MDQGFADDFAEISEALMSDRLLTDVLILLISLQPIPDPATEGGNRQDRFRRILKDLAIGEIGLSRAILRVEDELPRRTSIHFADDHVFARGWAEALVRGRFSAFHRQAVRYISRTRRSQAQGPVIG
jgi:hypothetical protein